MAYTNKVMTFSVAVTIAVLLLAVAIAPQWREAKPPKKADKLDTVCPLTVPEIVQKCYYTSMTMSTVLPSVECCNDLKTASKTEVTCLCDNVIAHPNPLYANLTKVYFNQVNVACGVLDKYACDGGNASGGALTSKIAAWMSLFGVVASLFF